LVIDWMTIGAMPPTPTAPTRAKRLLRRTIEDLDISLIPD
jgi:hypothetical protein